MDLEKEFRDTAHLINVTFRMVKEPKLLISIVSKLTAIANELLDRYLHKALADKKINFVPSTIDAKIAIYNEKLISQGYDKEFIRIVKRLNELNDFIKKGLLVSKEQSIIVYKDNTFSSEVVNISQVKDMIEILKNHYEKLK
ncbi:MAG: hypothetical protein QXS41_03245 [Candidatus Woesearchaeota archaeon]